MERIDPNFTSPGETRNYCPILRLVLLAAALVLGVRWLTRTYPIPFLDQTAYIETRQRANDATLSFYLASLAEHRAETGAYPLTLIDLLRPTRVPGGIARGIPPRDAWDHPLRFFSDGEMFLLVSVGRDGEPETRDYHVLREANRRESVCDDPDADLVASDRGWHARCRRAGD